VRRKGERRSEGGKKNKKKTKKVRGRTSKRATEEEERVHVRPQKTRFHRFRQLAALINVPQQTGPLIRRHLVDREFALPRIASCGKHAARLI
jgi:hypothetical protein